MLYQQNCSLNNVTVTLGNNSIRVQGNISDTTHETHATILLKSAASVATNKIYTYGSAGNSCTANSFIFGVYMDGEIVYNRNTSIDSDPEPIVQIKKMTGNPFMITCNIYDINASNPNGTFDITFKPAFLYEGSFKNPPINTSLDRNGVNLFARKIIFNWYFTNYLASAGSSVGWRRIYKIEGAGGNTTNRYTFYGKIRLMKRYSNGLYESYIIDFSLYYTSGEEANAGYYIDPKAYRSFSTKNKRFSKFAIVRGTDGNVYLSGYYNQALNDSFSVDILDFATNDYSYQRGFSYDSLSTRLKNIVYNNRRVFDASVYNSDTILGAAVNVVDMTTNFTMPS